MLWTLKYRKPMGVHTTFIEAPDFAKAEETGRFFCSNQSGPGFRYIGVEKAIAETYAGMLLAQGRTVDLQTLAMSAVRTTTQPQPVPAAQLAGTPTTTTDPKTTTEPSRVDPELAELAAAAGAGRQAKATKEPKPTAAAIAPPASSGRIGQ